MSGRTPRPPPTRGLVSIHVSLLLLTLLFAALALAVGAATGRRGRSP